MDAEHGPPEGGADSGLEEPPKPIDPPQEGRRRRGNRHHALRRKKRMRGAKGAKAAPRGGWTSVEMLAARPSGRTPGISTAEEPAAVPLGTDDEAAGTPARIRDLEIEIERARSGGGMQGLTASEAMSGRPGHPSSSLLTVGTLALIAVVVAMLGVLAVLLF